MRRDEVYCCGKWFPDCEDHVTNSWDFPDGVEFDVIDMRVRKIVRVVDYGDCASRVLVLPSLRSVGH
jgi:hypothetical protein